MTASGTLGLYPKFRADDLDGNPLEGGRLYSFLSGTSTPLALYADAALTTALPNPLVLDASGEALFYYGPATYKLALHDAADVPLWVIDPVTGTGGGASAGVGWGQNTVELRPANGAAQAAASVFPPDVLAIGLTLWITETFGTSRGLQQVGIGTALQPDQWGYLPTLTATTDTTAGAFQAYSGQPQPTPGMVTLTAYGGLFDGVGAVYLTGHFCTLTPSQQLGTSYVPPAGAGVQPLPVASETTAGITRYATDAEAIAGTLTTVATHPAGVRASINDAITASGATTTTGLWRWEPATTGAPASGDVALNQTDYALATEVRIHKISSGGTDASAVLAGLLPGDGIYIQDRNDSTRRARYSVTAAGVDQGTWASFAVANVAVGTVAFANNQETTVTFTIATSLPPATETQAGITRYATAADTTAGSVGNAAVTPVGLAAKVPAGTPLSVTRYASGGASVEGTPVTITADGNVGIRDPAPAVGLVLRGETSQALGQFTQEVFTTGGGFLASVHRKAGGTAAAPVRLTLAQGVYQQIAQGWLRNAGDTADAWVQLVRTQVEMDSLDAQGRAGGRWTLWTAPAVSASSVERLRVDQTGQLGVGTTTPTALLDVNSNTLRLRTARTPASATAAGDVGSVCWDANYVYVCVATNSWKRAALAAW